MRVQLVYGGKPPDAVEVALYGTPTVAVDAPFAVSLKGAACACAEPRNGCCSRRGAASPTGRPAGQ